jgi:hypothetical protein
MRISCFEFLILGRTLNGRNDILKLIRHFNFKTEKYATNMSQLQPAFAAQ